MKESHTYEVISFEHLHRRQAYKLISLFSTASHANSWLLYKSKKAWSLFLGLLSRYHLTRIDPWMHPSRSRWSDSYFA